MVKYGIWHGVNAYWLEVAMNHLTALEEGERLKNVAGIPVVQLLSYTLHMPILLHKAKALQYMVS